MKLSFSTARLAVLALRDIGENAGAKTALDAALPVILTEPVLRHLPPDLQHTGARFDPQAWLSTLTARNDVSVVTPRTSCDPIGFLTLRAEQLPDRAPHVWIGYLFAEPAWGHGYATELVTGAIAVLRDATDAQIRAGVAAGNTASMHVLQKAGFVVDDTDSGADLTIFALPLS